jgi:tRNA pseudouridine65 synthase
VAEKVKRAPFTILYEDDDYVAIDKPWGMLVHRTRISEDNVFVLQLLRNQIKRRVYPVHRLDRATSGVLIFGKTTEAASRLGILFQDKVVEKQYLAVVRGYVDEQGTIDYALVDDAEGGDLKQPAITHYTRLDQSEIDAAIGLRYPTARFSLVAIELETGRRQQIRKHFAHIFHPVIGDKRHGDVKHNTYFREVFNMPRMLLHSYRLSFVHPGTNIPVEILAPVDEIFEQALQIVALKIPEAGSYSIK